MIAESEHGHWAPRSRLARGEERGVKRPRTEVSITATECGSEHPSTARRAVPLPRYAEEDRRSRPSRTR